MLAACCSLLDVCCSQKRDLLLGVRVRGQVTVRSPKGPTVLFHGRLVALVQLHAGRAAVLVELADAVHLVAAAVADRFHYLRGLVHEWHGLLLVLERAKDVVVHARMIQQLCPRQKFIRFE